MNSGKGDRTWLLATILAGVLQFCSAPVASAQAYLYNQLQLQVGGGVNFVIAADFNADGIPDLATTNGTDGTVSVLLGKPGGTFSAQATYFISGYPCGPNALVAADFNGDGKLDLAVASLDYDCSGQVSVLLGNGDGTFQSPVTYTAGGRSSGVVAADFNGDGKLDLAVADFGENPSFSGSVAVLFGNGDGTFQNPVSFSVGMGASVLSSGDFNSDGRIDLILSNSISDTVSVLLNNGDGTFTRVDSSTGTAFPGPMTVADFNGDGKLDAAVVTNYTSLIVLLGNGDGSFQSPVDVPVPTGGEITALTAADFNHDGKLDLVTGVNAGVISILKGNGDGTFQTAINSDAPSPVSLAVADFNGDGQLDVADAWGDLVYILLGNGDCTFTSEVNSPLPPAIYIGPMVVADLNGDGKPDVVAEERTNSGQGLVQQLAVELAKGDGTFQNPITTSIGNALLSPMVTGDFNGDGQVDVAGINGQSLSVLLGNGDGTFGAVISTPLPSGLSPIGIAAGDFNRDGKTDLATTASNGTNTVLVIFLANGDGTLTMGAEYPLGSFSYSTNVIAADFNQDGNLDLAAVNPSTAQLFVLLGNGNGTFQNPFSTTIQLTTGYLTAADFNGDGKLDLALAQVNGIFTLLGNGDGTFQAPVIATDKVSEINLLAPGDFNSDGKMDLAVAGTGGAGVSVLLGAGDGTFSTVNWLAAFPNVGGLGAADFNSDGTLDLAFSTTSGFPSPALIGMISGPFVSLSPPSVEFGAQELGVTSAPASVVVANIGNAPLSVTGVSLNGDFSQTNTCEGTVSAGANCAIDVTFTPTAPGQRNGTLTIADNVVTSPQVVALSGTGGSVAISPASLSYQGQVVGTTSGAQHVTLTNLGSTALTITSIEVNGNFSQTNNCGTSVAGSANCTINVTFSPTSTGALGGMLTIVDSDPSSPQTVSLSGTGTTPQVSVSSASLTFASQLLNTSSASQSFSLTNTGSGALTITGIAISGANGGDFSETSTCGSSVAAGSSCNVSVTFKPTAGGTRTGTLTVTDNNNGTPGSMQPVTLTGTGATLAAAASPATMTFSSQLVGTSSATQNVTLTNTGTVGFNITALTISGDFRQTNNCGAALAASATCTITVAFVPTASGSRSGLLTINDTNNAGAGTASTTETVSLTGTGATLAAVASPATMAFPGQLVGTSSATQSVTLTNTGTVGFNITGLTISGDFRQTNNCGAALAAGATCTITVAFVPTASGSRSGLLTINDTNNAGAGTASTTETVSLTGTGTAPAVSLAPSALPAFASQPVGSRSAAQAITLANTGSATLSVSSITISGANAGDFAESNTCGSSLAEGASCTLSVTFTPSGISTRSATLTITDNANAVTNSAQSVSLSGTGSAGEVTLAPATVAFGGENVGSSSPVSTMTLTNSGNASLTIGGLALSGPAAKDFALQSSSTCSVGTALEASKNCALNLVFTPSAAGSRSATLTISDNANNTANSTQTVGLGGMGKDFALAALKPATVSAGQAATYTLTLTPESGFSGNVQVTCTEPAALTESTCTPSPASLMLDGSSATVTITVTTTAASMAPTVQHFRPPAGPKPTPLETGALMALGLLGLLGFVGKRRAWALTAVAALLVVFWASCGGGGGSIVGGGNPGTPAGTYELTVTVGEGTLTHTTTLSLTVQ